MSQSQIDEIVLEMLKKGYSWCKKDCRTYYSIIQHSNGYLILTLHDYLGSKSIAAVFTLYNGSVTGNYAQHDFTTGKKKTLITLSPQSPQCHTVHSDNIDSAFSTFYVTALCKNGLNQFNSSTFYSQSPRMTM